MGKLNFIKSRKDAQWSFQLNDGRIFEVIDKDGLLVVPYDTPINLETGDVGTFGQECPPGYTTLNKLFSEGKGKTVYCYDEYTVYLGEIKNLSKPMIRKIVSDFKKHGFNVTSRAILHNFNAWYGDMKSGYRDEKNGYHLFTPCGCNPFSLSATTLEDFCKSWQTSYIC